MAERAELDAWIDLVDDSLWIATHCAGCEGKLIDGECPTCHPRCSECGDEIKALYQYPEPEDGLCARCVERRDGPGYERGSDEYALQVLGVRVGVDFPGCM